MHQLRQAPHSGIAAIEAPLPQLARMLPHYRLQPNAMAGLLFHMETMASDLRSVLHGTVRHWAFQACRDGVRKTAQRC